MKEIIGVLLFSCCFFNVYWPNMQQAKVSVYFVVKERANRLQKAGRFFKGI